MLRNFDPDRYGNPAAKGRSSNKPNESDQRGSITTNLTIQLCDPTLKPPMFTPASLSPSGLSTKASSTAQRKIPAENKNNTQSARITRPSSPEIFQYQYQSTYLAPPHDLDLQVKMTSNNGHRGNPLESHVVAQDQPSARTKSISRQNPSTEPTHAQALVHMQSPDEILKQARERALRDISLRNRARDQANTTSLNDLGLARQANGTRGTHTVPMAGTFPRAASEFEPISPMFDQPSFVQREEGNLHSPILPDAPAPADRELTRGSVSGRQNRKGRKRFDTPRKTGDASPSAELCHDAISRSVAKPEWTAHDMGTSRWAPKEDLKPIKADLDQDALSNAWGSSIPSDASQASGDSTQALHSGKLFPRKRASVADFPLAGFDGKLQPPPADWTDRPRFDNRSVEFRNNFSKWVDDMIGVTKKQYNDVPTRVVNDMTKHADGVGMVGRTFTINESNAVKYGYEDVEDTTKYASAINAEDFEDWGKLDMSKAENVKFREECTENLVRNWVANFENRRAIEQARAETKQKAKEAKLIYRSEVNLNQPVLNIYLRPGVETDIPQCTEIYNYYVQNSPRPVELNPVEDDDVLNRLEDSQSNKLPFIVAVMRNKKSMIMEDDEVGGRSRPTETVDAVHGILRGIEKVVGFAVAQDMTAADYVERITVETEIYVDPESRQHGVGRCLMDQILEVLDRGYVKKGGYPFFCAPELRLMYTPGGERDIHKILMVIRKYKFPVDSNGRLLKADSLSKDQAKLNDRENDYDHWMKAWLETWGFQQEGLLSGIGAKAGRFLDSVYMGRETMWQPTEGRIPDPFPGNI